MTPRDTNGGRSRSDELIVAAVASGASFTEASAAAGVSRSTVARRMRDPEFRAEVIKARAEVVEAVKGRLLHAAPAAIRTLEEVGASGSAPPAARVAAAKVVLEHAVGRRSPLDLESATAGDFHAALRAVVGLALERLPEDSHLAFIEDVRRLAAR